jgi:hypothetical protein
MTEAPKKTRKKFSYRPRRLADVEQQQQIYGLRDAIYKAHKGDATELLAFLRSDLSMSHLEEYRRNLADLIGRFIQQKGHGQRGRAVPTAKGDMQAQFVARCRRRLKSIRAQSGGKTPRGAIKQVMDEIGTAMQDNDAFEDQSIDWEAARQSLLKQRR